MNGLEQIIEHLNNESEAECQQILANAQIECSKIESESEKIASGLVEDIMNDSITEKEKMLEAAKQKGETDSKKKLLNAKQELVSQVIAKALEIVQNLPENEYFALLAKLLNRFHQNKKGEIILSKKDIMRISADFKQKLEECELKIIKEEKLSGGGFILRYSEIEENCTFSAMLASKKELVQDIAYKILFN